MVQGSARVRLCARASVCDPTTPHPIHYIEYLNSRDWIAYLVFELIRVV